MTTSIFKVVNWQEKFTIEESVAHATAEYQVTGDLIGNILVDYSIFYLDYHKEEIHESSSRFEGFAIFYGEIAGKTGSFAFYDRGHFINNRYQAEVSIIEGTGTGDFIQISGAGTYLPVQNGMQLELAINFGKDELA